MANNVVHRRANGLREASIVEGCGDGVLHFGNVLVADVVELIRGYAGLHVLANHIENIGRQAARNSHFVLLFFCL